MRPDKGSVRSLFAYAALGLAFVLIAMPASGAVAQNSSTQLKPATLVEGDNSQCNVSSLVTVCQGAYTSNSTFRATLSRGDLVTMAVAYLYGNSDSANLTFSDSLGNAAVAVTSQCAGSSPDICTAVGYFLVTNGGTDDVYFTVQGGTTGELWYNAEIWEGQIANVVGVNGSSASCIQSCGGNLSIGPVSIPSSRGAVAISAYAAFYPYTPATWQSSYVYYYSATDFQSSGGDSVFWQGTTSLLSGYQFAASTSPVPNSWGGSAEVLFWNHP